MLLVAAVLPACGGEADDEAWRYDANRVFDRAMQAVHDADWATLRTLLTKNARFALENDLRLLERRLAHPEDGRRTREVARERLGADYAAELERATQGGVADVLRFFVLLSPRAARPPTGRREFARRRVEILYADEAGNQHSVRLVRRPEGWLVDDLQL
jgi:hypothetical protein